jgi:tRNA 2-thiouridine synthesizing protein A
MTDPVRIDARGQKCPWPVVRLARAAREGAHDILIRADDPIAPAEIAALAEARGWTLAKTDEGFHIKIAVQSAA